MGTTSYEYDTNRRIEAINYDYSLSGLTNVQRVEYTYNEDSSIDTVTWKDDVNTVATWAYTYDQAGRIASVTSFGETTTYTYDGQNKILTQTNDNGTSTEYTYNDDRGWRTNITQDNGGTPFAEYDLTYDAGSNTVGNLTRVDESGGDYVVYAYNDLHRLTSETRTGIGSFANTFVYDLAGNLTTLNSSSFATYDSANKIASIPSGSISNDADGNITAVTGAGLSATSLSWDSRSKLVSQTNSSVTIDYGYDNKGRRIWSQVGANPKTYFIYSADKLVGEISGSPQFPTAAYTWGADGLISERLIQGGDSYWYHFGPQGETRQLTDNLGATVNSYAYDAYGKTLSSSGSVPNSYKYGGKYGYYTDGSAGMMLAGARWYSSLLKRWISRDPIKYEGGFNLYEYVNGNPMRYVDPSGNGPEEALSALSDFWRYYREVKNRNGTDKYYHCKSHCSAVKRGAWGNVTSLAVGVVKEAIDTVKNPLMYGMSLQQSFEDCDKDTLANVIGRVLASRLPGVSCESICDPLWPNGMDRKFQKG